MDTKKLRQKILDLAIRGKLVPQDPNDEPASVLLERIKAEKEQLIKEGKIKRSKKSESADKPHYENVPFEIPESWVWTTLGTIGKWQSGATPSRMRKDYYGGGIPWLKTGDLNDGFITDIPETITPLALSETSVKLNPAGSILIAMYGATIGKIGILTKPATTNQACCACVSHNGVEQMYLFYFLLSYKEEFIRQGGGGAQPNISKEKIIETYIPLPPLCEQNRIVNEVAKWNKIIDNIESERSDLLAIVSQIKSKILDFAISGKLIPQNPADEPAIELLKRINSNFIPCDNSHYEKPKSWEQVAMGCVVDIVSGVSYSKSDIRESGIRILRGGNIQNGTINEALDDVFIDTKYRNESNTIKKCDIVLVASTGSQTLIGKTGYVKESSHNTQIGAFLRIIRPKFCDISPFLNLVFNSNYYKDYIRTIAKGTNINNIKNSYIENLCFGMPPLKEQVRIVNEVNKIFTLLDTITAELQ